MSTTYQHPTTILEFESIYRKEYAQELESCDRWIKFCERESDTHGINFHEGLRGAHVFNNIKMEQLLRVLKHKAPNVSDEMVALLSELNQLRTKLEQSKVARCEKCGHSAFYNNSCVVCASRDEIARLKYDPDGRKYFRVCEHCKPVMCCDGRECGCRGLPVGYEVTDKCGDDCFAKVWNERKQLMQRIPKLEKAVALLNSMILSGEDHSDTSRQVVKEALVTQ